ncbi:hypothetical protein I656_00113 [Geobacillus sp. WSUCF1]|nr:hypothetical protein I656_00113 [Geobacillus sp. WSUCF1]
MNHTRKTVKKRKKKKAAPPILFARVSSVARGCRRLWLQYLLRGETGVKQNLSSA